MSLLDGKKYVEPVRQALSQYFSNRWGHIPAAQCSDAARMDDRVSEDPQVTRIADLRWKLDEEIPSLLRAGWYGEARDAITTVRAAMRYLGMESREEINMICGEALKQAAA